MGVRIIRGQDQQGPTATPTSTAVGMIDAVLDFVAGDADLFLPVIGGALNIHANTAAKLFSRRAKLTGLLRKATSSTRASRNASMKAAIKPSSAQSGAATRMKNMDVDVKLQINQLKTHIERLESMLKR